MPTLLRSIEAGWPCRIRAAALALAPSLLVVLALLYGRSARLYFLALAMPGPFVAAMPAAFATAALSAALCACMLWSPPPSRGDARDGDRKVRTGLCASLALVCAAVAAYLAAAGPVPQRHQHVSHLLHGLAPLHASIPLVAALSLLALSPVVVRLLRMPRALGLPSVLVPGAIVGALAALNRPTGCEAVIAEALLAATLTLWMLLELAQERASRGGPERTPGTVPQQTSQGAGAQRSAGLPVAPPGTIGRKGFVIGVLLCCGIGLWLTWPGWQHGIILNQDAPRHLLRARIMAEMFLPAGHIDGWSPYWYLGAQLFLFQSYGYFFVIGAVADLLGGWVRLADVFKFFYALPIIVLPASVAWLARGLGASRRAALVAAFACLALGSAVGYGVKGVYGTGLLLQGVGIVLFAIVWPLVLDALEGKARAAWIASLLLGVIFVTHFITAAYVMAAAGVVAFGLALWNRDAAPLLRYTGLAVAALLLSAHALFPSLELRNLAGSAVGWGGMEDRFVRFLVGRGVGPPWLVVPALLAAVAAIVRGRGRLGIAALLLFGTALAASSSSPYEPDLVTRILRVVLRPRSIPYAVLLTAVFVGVAFDAVFTFIASVRSSPDHAICGSARSETTPWPWRQAAFVVAGVSLLCAGLIEIVTLRSQVSTEATLRRRDHGDYAQLVRWLRRNVPLPAIVEIDRNGLPSRVTGAPSVISILNLDTGLFTLGGDQAELTNAGSRSRSMGGDKLAAQADLSARRLRSFGVSYVIATDMQSRRRLDLSKEYERAFEGPRAAVYRIRHSGAWLTGPGIQISQFKFAPEHLRWQVLVSGGRSRQATATVSWHPDWQALVDGHAVPAVQTTRHLVAFDIEPGAHVVELKYVRRIAEHVYDAISLGALLVVAGGFVLSRRGPPLRARVDPEAETEEAG